MLALNKRDLFEKKIATKSFSRYFPDFNGDENNSSECVDFMARLFLNEIREHPMDNVVVKTLSAVDHDNTKKVFEEVKDFVMEQYQLKQSN